MSSFVATWAIAGGIAVLAVAVIGSILLHKRARQLKQDSSSDSSSPSTGDSSLEGAAGTKRSKKDRAESLFAKAFIAASTDASPHCRVTAQAPAAMAHEDGELGLTALEEKAFEMAIAADLADQEAHAEEYAAAEVHADGTPVYPEAGNTEAGATGTGESVASDSDAEAREQAPASGEAGKTDATADGSTAAASSNKDDAKTKEHSESDVVIEASQALNAFDLERTIRQLRRDYWASRWLLGEEACDDLRQALGKARGMVSSCLADTLVFEDVTESFPPGCERLNSVIAAIEEPARPLRALRYTKFIHAAASYRMNPPEDVNPHRAAIRAGRYVSPDPTYGLNRLVSEIEVGLAQARLEIAKVSPTAGTAVSSRLRSGLADATSSLREGEEALGKLENPTQEDIQQIEAHLLRAVWWRRFIDLSVKFLSQKEWAQTSTDRNEWTRLAVLVSRLTHVLVDLNEDSVSRADLIELARAQILIDQGSKADRRDVPVRTAQQVVETCEQLVNKLSTSTDMT